MAFDETVGESLWDIIYSEGTRAYLLLFMCMD